MLVTSRNEKIKNNSITIDKNKETFSVTQWRKVTLSGYTLRGSLSEKMIPVNDGIKIGKGVNRIKVNATIKISFNENLGNGGIYISKNGEVPTDIYYSTTKGWITYNLTNQIFDVVENDVISCVVVSEFTSNNAQIDLGYITAEVIE